MALSAGYSYEPLRAPSSIRLLKILPDCVDDKISCTIEEFRSEEKIEYHALSYTWGCPTATRKILLNGHETGLHENLWQFLRQMQENGRCSPYYWTDSLCLNQQNAEEIKQQVVRMGAIYASAALVVVWLGQDVGLGEELWLCPYWGRVWIVQEFLLAKEITIAYDTRTKDFESFVAHVKRQISWERYSLLGIRKQEYELLRNTGLRWADGGFGFMPKGFDSQVSYRLRGESSWRHMSLSREYLLVNQILDLCSWKEDPKCDFLRLLDLTAFRQSTKAIDRAYGLLGLATEPYIEQRINVNYDKTLWELYWDLLFELTPPTKVDQPQQQTVTQWKNFILNVNHSLFSSTVDTNQAYDSQRLETYANSAIISDKHQNIALSTLCIIQAIQTLQEHASSMASLISFLCWEIDLLENDAAGRAVALGLGLSSINYDDHRLKDTAKSSRRQGQAAQTSNQWRCWRHYEYTDNDHVPASTVLNKAKRIRFFLPQSDEVPVHGLCGQRGDPGCQDLVCDESIIVLDLRDLEISIWTDDEAFERLVQRHGANVLVSSTSNNFGP